MKNRKAIVTTSIVLIVLSPFVAYEAFLFVAHDFSPDYSEIDSCLDAGGKWDYETRVCRSQGGGG